jgi:hypothetical protein
MVSIIMDVRDAISLLSVTFAEKSSELVMAEIKSLATDFTNYTETNFVKCVKSVAKKVSIIVDVFRKML